MKSLQTGESLEVAAAKAGMDEKTARKWRQVAQPPTQTREPRNYRTRPDAFSDLWAEIEQLLERDASLEARTIFDHLCRQYPERFQESQLRTLQRRVKVWRARKGSPREVFFPQVHLPGRQAQSDFTHLTELNVTICGQLFKHLFYHFTLTYSNWEWGMVCASESWEALCEGLQNALWELGGVPEEHRTDSLSAAVKPIGSRAEFTDRYQGLLRHYGLQASHSSPGRGHENGDVEQSHHRFKNAVGQELILRGSRDFDSRGQYEQFLRAMLERRNQGRRERLGEELKSLRGLPERRLEGFTKESQRVGRNSTISVRGNHYSVPSQLIGERVEVRVYGGHLEVWYAEAMIERMERLRGEGQAQINYRHIIHSLVRKPGAFAHYRFQSSLYPSVLFRVAYDELRERLTGNADREYLKLLKLAADEGEERVSGILREMIGRGEAIGIERVRELVGEQREQSLPSVPRIEINAASLASYDQLIGVKEVTV
ncbi:MAG: IS21 family transposase [Blastocatellia bacterium]